MDRKRRNCIIWDWNGTLLDDVDVCVETINYSLEKRDLRKLDAAYYREVFTFPVRDYYRTVGFDFNTDPFDILAKEFMDIYRDGLKKAKLFDDVNYALESIEKMGMEQIVLSAMEQSLLERYLEHFGILDYFTHVQGVGNDYADGKDKVAKQLMEKLHSPVGETFLIGDTLHDREVAALLGIPCLLVGRGHQSMERLLHGNHTVFSNLVEVVDYLKNRC